MLWMSHTDDFFTGWGTRLNPLWPTMEEARNCTWSLDPAWLNGPNYTELIYSCLPAIRAYFLLGYRVNTLMVVDYIAGTAALPSPIPQFGLDLVNGITAEFTTVSPEINPDEPITDPTGTAMPNMVELAEGAIHVVFGLEPIGDVTGWIQDHRNPDDPLTYTGYNVPLDATTNVLSLPAGRQGLADLQGSAADLVTNLFALIRPLWVDISDDNQGPRLERKQAGGMLWVFDPAYWDAPRQQWGQFTDAADQADRFLAALNYRESQRAVPNLVPKVGNLPSSIGVIDSFLMEQIFNLKSDARPFFEGGSGNNLSSFVDLHDAQYSDGAAPIERPSLAHYNYDGFARVNAENDQFPHADPPLDTYNMDPVLFWTSMERYVAFEGYSHIWDFWRWQSINSAGPSESWLDSILALAWDGAFALRDAVEPRDPQEPMRVDVYQGGTSREEWSIALHQKTALSITLATDEGGNTGTASRAGFVLSDKVVFEYRPGGAGLKPTLFIVAGRGVEIKVRGEVVGNPSSSEGFLKHYKQFFDRYNSKHPWDLNITRVQDDALIPRRGSQIDPARILSRFQVNPSRLTPAPDVAAAMDPPQVPVHEIPLAYRVEELVGTSFIAQREIEVVPHSWGEIIKFPALADIWDQSAFATSEALKVYRAKYSQPAQVELCVDPFSGKGGYTYSIYLERYDVVVQPPVSLNKIINTHCVVVLTDNVLRDVEMRTSLSAEHTFLHTWWEALTGWPSNTTGVNSRYFPFGDSYVGDMTGEFYKARADDLQQLPAPLAAELPVRWPAAPRVMGWYNDADASTRISRLDVAEMHQPPPDAGTWMTVRIGDQDIDIAALSALEWYDSAIDDVVYLVVDLLISAIPVIGDASDAIEFAFALVTGKDRWGRKVTGFDIALMGLATAIPLVSSRMMTLGADVADAARVPQIQPRQMPATRSASQSFDAFLEVIMPHVRGVMGSDAAASTAAREEITAQAYQFFARNKVGNRHLPQGTQKARVGAFVDSLVRNVNVLENLMEAARPTDARKFLSVADVTRVVLKNGVETTEFTFNVLQTGFNQARAKMGKRHRDWLANPDAFPGPMPHPDSLTPEVYLRHYAVGVGRAAGRALLGARVMGTRVKRAIGYLAPTMAGRVQRNGPAVALTSISRTDLRAAVKQYLLDAAADKDAPMMWSALTGAETLTDVKSVAREVGHDLSSPSVVTDNHPILMMFDDLIKDGPDASKWLDDLLRGGRSVDNEIPLAEVGARVGECIIMASDQLVHLENVAQLRGAGLTFRVPLAQIAGDAVREPMRKMIADWVNSGGRFYEHAIKSEMRDIFALKKAVHEIDPASELGGFTFEVVIQAKMVSLSGRTVQMGSDAIVYAVRGSTRTAIDFQLKSYGSLGRVAGFAGLDFVGGGIPRVVVKQRFSKALGEFVWSWDVVGGSSIQNQVVKQRLRVARFGGLHPPSNLVKGTNIPRELPNANQLAGWSSVGRSPVYTIDSEQFMSHLISRLDKLYPLERLRDFKLRDLKRLTPDEQNVLNAMFPRQNDAGWQSGIDLSSGARMFGAFNDKSVEIAQSIERTMENYEDIVPNFKAAFWSIAGPNATLETHSVYVRFTKDADIESALRIGLGIAD